MIFVEAKVNLSILKFVLIEILFQILSFMLSL